ncbi:MAG TPA: ABC transporter ATP-binding protein [Vicinamibacterales bacterium]|nr:ABC transporter ATP-binding protein [Vicinamibacterales bacterium]
MAEPAAPDFDRVDLLNVTRRYGRRRALSRATLTCHAGDIVGLFGPNGAGKSTLLSILSTLVAPSEGEVRFGGQLAPGLGDALRGRIGVLGHDLFLYSDLTARENLEFFGRLHGVRDLAARVAAGLAEARLTERAGDRVGAFSRGLRQRLGLARALLHGPRLVLLDEPFTGLDDESVHLLAGRLRALQAAGAIVVMATHDFETADGLVDRPVCLREGRMRALAPGPERIRERYRQALAEAWT